MSMVLSISRKRACFYGAVAIAQSVGSSMRILPILPACKHDTFLSDRGGTQTCLQPATGIERPRPDAVRSGSVSRIQAVTASPHWAPWASGIFSPEANFRELVPQQICQLCKEHLKSEEGRTAEVFYSGTGGVPILVQADHDLVHNATLCRSTKN